MDKPIYNIESRVEIATEKGLYRARPQTEVAAAFYSGFNLGAFVASARLCRELAKNQNQISTPQKIQLHKLNNYELRSTLDIVVEPDADGYIARIPALTLYGYGDDMIESIDMLIDEVESLYEELNSEDIFDKEWESVKLMLNNIIVPTNG